MHVHAFSHIAVFKTTMINLLQWQALIGCFNSGINLYIGCEVSSSTNNVVLLHMVVTAMHDVAVLQTYMQAVTVLLLIHSGNTKMNPGPVLKFYPNCNICIHINREVL